MQKRGKEGGRGQKHTWSTGGNFAWLSVWWDACAPGTSCKTQRAVQPHLTNVVAVCVANQMTSIPNWRSVACQALALTPFMANTGSVAVRDETLVPIKQRALLVFSSLAGENIIDWKLIRCKFVPSVQVKPTFRTTLHLRVYFSRPSEVLVKLTS